MKRKRFITAIQIGSIFLLLSSFLLLIAVRLSEKGDIIDRNSTWILLAFISSIGLFVYSHYIPDGLPYKKKTTLELMEEIKKTNLRKKVKAR